jgi:hypothetical protein
MEFENGHPKPACKDKILVMIEFPTLGKLKILQESPLPLGMGSSVTGSARTSIRQEPGNWLTR